MSKNSKVISLFGGNDKDKDYAVALKNVVDKFNDDFPNNYNIYDKFEFTVIAWNLAVSKTFIDEEVMDAFEIEELDVQEKTMLKTLSAYKTKKYESYTNYIVDLDLDFDGINVSLNLKQIEHSDFVNLLNNSFGDFEDDEDEDFDFFDEEELNTLDRYSIFIRPKKALVDWVNNLYPKNKTSLNEINEGTTYLYEAEWNGTYEDWLSINFDSIFTNELLNWHSIEADWPQNRTLSLFKKWFSYDFASLVIDLENKEIEKW